jgi:GNAT superfamily N-acetyltransferase
MEIRIAATDTEIAACWPVMHELRPHVAEAEFLARVRNQEKAGYRLLLAEEEGGVVAVAGFRIGENLAWGRFLYVDDLVTLPAHRSKGTGSALLSWLKAHAAEQGCGQLHLDSGLQRRDAHRFYEREGLPAAGCHFAAVIVKGE